MPKNVFVAEPSGDKGSARSVQQDRKKCEKSRKKTLDFFPYLHYLFFDFPQASISSHSDGSIL